MEYDSESSCDGRIKDLNILNSSKTQPEFYPRSDRILRASVATSWQCVDVVDSGTKPRPIANKFLSEQVMEYYHKYSQSSNLEQFFSLPASSNYYNLYKPSTKIVEDTPDCISDNYSLKIPKERRRWVRPPLVGQSTVNVDRATVTLESKLVWPDSKIEDKSESQEFEKKSSPTSSVASVKPLEWDSLADVGYSNFNPQKTVDTKLSTIERMVLHTGCSSALRLDPEGTEPVNCQTKPTVKSFLQPQANSTLLSSKGLSESESEREITPIVKRHYQKSDTNDKKEKTSTFYTTANSLPKHSSMKRSPREPLLKKSPSMNLLKASGSQVSLKRSQSELNICAKDKYKILPRLIFNSTSSIATVVNKCACNKVIQSSEQAVRRNVKSESVGIQVCVPEDADMAGQSKRPQSILKNSNNYRSRSKSQSRCDEDEEARRRGKNKKTYQSSATSVDSVPSTSRPDENVTGRANSFEYFPGHVYKCAQEEKTSSRMSSRVSSVETGNSHSTMPNTSSSLEEKLWGKSDSLLCDLEKSLKILQSLVNENKCDKQTRERFIHHVVNRLVSANYTDDKLEENSNSKETSSWNSEDDKKKVYRQKKTTTDSSEDWRPQRKKEVCKKDKQKKKLAAESSSDKFDRNTDRTETDGRKARMGLRADDCYQKSESSDCFVPPRGYGKMSKSERKDSTSLSITNQESELLEEIEDKSQSTINSNNNENDWESPFQTERDYEGKENSETESEGAKLINYAEMEKRNQLVWITNEISHLLNLKRLLEKPKKVLPTKSSTSKHKDDKSPAKTPAKKESSKNQKRSATENSFESRLHKQWSSHCNLSTCDPISHSSFSTVKCIRKRNSYSQTACNINHADSKSGAEIISAQKVSTQIVKITSSSSQTSPFKSNKVNTASQTQTYSQMADDLKICLKTCSCLQCENKRSIMSLPASESCLKECICKSNEQLKLKEAKNQMNSKLNMQKSVQKQCCHCKVQEKLFDRVCKCVPSSSTGSSNCDYDQIVTVSCNYCSSCGLSYRNKRTCKCRVVVPKPIAYEITFEEEKKQNDNCRVKSNDKRLELNEPVVRSCRNVPGSSGRCHCDSDDEEKEKEDYEGKETLEEYLQSNNPKFLINTETRQKYISEMSELRQIKKEKRKQLLAMTSTSELVKSLKTQKIKKHSRKDFSKEKLKALSRQRYLSLNEVRAKRKQKEKEEALRHNKLMAHLFCKKLQQKVLRGQVDLSQSTSVISNF